MKNHHQVPPPPSGEGRRAFLFELAVGAFALGFGARPLAAASALPEKNAHAPEMPEVAERDALDYLNDLSDPGWPC